MTTTIAIGNQKGGVAKTTTTLSLGAALADRGHGVLLVDLDPQANLTLSLGLQPHNLAHTAIDALLGTDSLVGVSRESDIFRMDIVPSNHELVILDKVLANTNGQHLRLQRKMDDAVRQLYDFVLIDCPPSAGNLTMNALVAADLLIVPVQCEFYAAHSLRQTSQLVRRAQVQDNPHLQYRVLVTIYDQRNKISRLILEQLRGALAGLLFDTVIQIDTKLRESPAYGKPIVHYAPGSRGARQYRDLADEVLMSLVTESTGR
jgi:chromosome partitioning protein